MTDQLANPDSQRVEVDRGGEVVEVAPDGFGFARRGHTARGAITRLEFFCEAGHHFALRLQLHKGSTFFRLERGPDIPEGGRRGTLWRD